MRSLSNDLPNRLGSVDRRREATGSSGGVRRAPRSGAGIRGLPAVGGHDTRTARWTPLPRSVRDAGALHRDLPQPAGQLGVLGPLDGLHPNRIAAHLPAAVGAEEVPGAGLGIGGGA